MRAFKFVIPIMVIIAWVSWVTLARDHAAVPEKIRVYITIGAVLLSGIISYYLFPKDEGEKY